MANINNTIVATMAASKSAFTRPNEYLGNVKEIPILITAATALVNNADVIYFTAKLPQKCRALAISLSHDSSDGVGASTTLAITAGGTLLTKTATIPTSADTNSLLLYYSLENTDVSGLQIIGTVGGDDWDDDTDLTGFITVVTDQ